MIKCTYIILRNIEKNRVLGQNIGQFRQTHVGAVDVSIDAVVLFLLLQ